jgi:RimJ/RimL family protein N-acetyltransferase
MAAQDSPVGPPVDTAPAARPGPVTLTGRYGRVERLNAARHGDALWDAFRADDSIWTYLPFGPFPDRRQFDIWLDERLAQDDPYFYAVTDVSGRALGVAALMEIRPQARVIEVGAIVLSPALQRTPLATEAQYLLARYAFDTLRFRRYEWKCNVLNAPSRHAAARFGFTFEGLFRSHMIVKGRSRDTAWFSIIEDEWPARKAAFELWLAPENFDADGRQKVSLRALNARKD